MQIACADGQMEEMRVVVVLVVVECVCVWGGSLHKPSTKKKKSIHTDANDETAKCVLRLRLLPITHYAATTPRVSCLFRTETATVFIF